MFRSCKSMCFAYIVLKSHFVIECICGFFAVVSCMDERWVAKWKCDSGSLQWEATDIASVTFSTEGLSWKYPDIKCMEDFTHVDQTTLQYIASVFGSVLKLDVVSSASPSKIYEACSH